MLGVVEARVDGRVIELGHPRQVAVLAVLAVEADTIVSADRLLERVWGEHVPLRGRDTLYSYLSRLRRALGAVDDVRVTRRSGGYRLEVDAMAVDLHRFRHLVGESRTAGDDDRALALLDEALGLWRGEAFAGLDTPWLLEVRDTLAQQRLAAQLDRADLLLRRGRAGELVTELATLAAAHPFDERLAGQVMRALYLCGRQNDALEHYQRLRTRLVDDLGTEPGTEVRQLHQRILTADSSLTAPEWERPPIPRQLPAAPRLFTGREPELTRLSKAVDDGGAEAMVIAAIGGGGGVGKTWLALWWAHRNTYRFPDGQLYVDLNGFGPSGDPVPPAVAVRGFLEALGVDPAAVPSDDQARTGLYRSLAAGRRMLIVLDNARDSAHVTPLLPGDAACVVLVTSRQRLDGLVTAHGATPLALDVLTEAEARRVLTRHVGAERIAAEAQAAAELLAHCAGLPLAVAILAARVAATPDLPLATVADELRDERARLDTMGTGELSTNLREVFAGSYHALSGEAARLFRLLGVAALPEAGVHALASLAGTPVSRVLGPLRELAAAHLVTQHLPGRHSMHDLVSLYAQDCAGTEDYRDAVRRLVDCYLHTAHTADQLLRPHLLPITLEPPVVGSTPEPVTTAAEARAWFEREYACLTAIEHHARTQGWDQAVIQLAGAEHGFRQRRGHLHDNVRAWLAGVTAAERTGAPATQAVAHLRLGQALLDVGRVAEAREYLTRGLELAEVAGDKRVGARIHGSLAQTAASVGESERALAHASEAVELFRSLESPREIALVLGNLSWFQAQLGRYDDARASCTAALELHRDLADHDSLAEDLDTLGYIAHRTGNFADALEYHTEALRLARDSGHAHREATILDHLGDTHAALHQVTEARQAWQRAADLFRTQHRLPEAESVRRRLFAL